jgi:hypothetical protein
MPFPLAVRLLRVAAAALIAFPVAAEVELNPAHPQTYEVRAGDTLWDIAGRFLLEPWRWSEIWQENSELADPNLIFPGDVLRLHYENGRPRVRAQRGMRTVKLSPRVRVTPLKVPVPTVSVGSIKPFLTRPYVLQRTQIDASPYVVSFPDRRVLGGTYDTAYVRSMYGNVGERLSIVRPGEPYRDPDTGAVLGYKALHVADAVLERPGNPATVRIQGMSLETVIGDRVLPSAGEEPLQTFFPRPAPQGRRGRIISVLNGVSQIGQHNVVVLNLGSRHGLERGHVFDVFNGGERVTDTVRADASRWDWKNMRFWSQEFWYGDYRTGGFLEGEPNANEPFPPHVEARRLSEDYILPFERAGTIMVFRTFPQVSFALVMRAARSMHVLDAVRPPRT